MKKAIFASAHAYDSPFKLGDHHYAKLLSQKGYEILWLDMPTSYIYYFKDKENYYKDYDLSKSSPRKVDDNIYEYCPYTYLPYIRIKPLDSIFVGKNSLQLCNRNLKKFFDRAGYGECDLLWISNPKYTYLDKFVQSKCIIHRMGDDFSKFDGLPSSFMDLELRLIEKSNIYYVTAKSLMDKYSQIKKPKYLSNGCDYKHFQKNSYDFPMEYIKYETMKKVLYVGAIDSWFDLELLKYSVEENEEVQFFIIGPNRISLDVLKHYKNVHILGKRNYKDIPNYMYYSDLGIIPFKINDLTMSVNPIKLFEYSACGVPTIVTDMQEVSFTLENLRNMPIYIAKDKIEFSNYIKSINKTDEDSRILKQFAEENSWDKRIEMVCSDIASYKNGDE
ncbi:hypothetical protein LF65_01177 [Clostridium beijerinckii]|uniref:Glycosyl transferase family 1 domain-containing protein n=1 Tax=Clostridium beijerinckii TaxID=1520 RepID=A0A0B5QHU5_CLOBE|nr:glycosyltransferase [Clostridium beijerinckii]AJG97791.1 hypothetical protein LF65_01177 [Clostridium beijerinckii]